MSLCNARNDLGKVMVCFPLAVFALVFAAIQTAFPLLTITELSVVHQHDAMAVVAYVFAAFQVVLGVFALGTVVLKWMPGLKILNAIAPFMILSWLIYGVLDVVIFTLRLKDAGGATPGNWAMFAISLALIVCSLALSCRLVPCIASLIMVVGCGGTGFEGLSYKQLKTGVQYRAFTAATLSSDSLDTL